MTELEKLLLVVFIGCDIVFTSIAYVLSDVSFGVIAAVAIITTVLYALKVK